LLGLAAPVTGATLGWVAFGQSLAPVQLVGFAITLAAIAYGASLGLEPEPRGTGETQGGSSRSAEKDGSAHAIRQSTDIGDHRRTTIIGSGYREMWPMGTPGCRCRCDTRTDHAYQTPMAVRSRLWASAARARQLIDAGLPACKGNDEASSDHSSARQV
jgi:hypothetical protein